MTNENRKDIIAIFAICCAATIGVIGLALGVRDTAGFWISNLRIIFENGPTHLLAQETSYIIHFSKVILFLILMIYFFWNGVHTEKRKNHYLSAGFLCYFYTIAFAGITPGAEKLAPRILSMTQFWLILGVLTQTYFIGIWTGFWRTLNKQMLDAGKALLVLAALTIVTIAFITNDPVNWQIAIFLLPIVVSSMFWIGAYLLEAPRARLLFSAFLYLLSGGIFFLCLIATEILPPFVFINQTVSDLIALPALLSAAFMLETNRTPLLDRPNAEQDLAIKQKEAARKRVLSEERGRFTRDVHDGIGGHLLSLLVRVRNKSVSNAEIETELQSGLNDLRLIVDSLDSDEEDFISAIRSLHARILPQLKAADIRLVWGLDESCAEHVHFGPRDILNIYRFMQEAVANTIRHSKADEVKIKIGRSEKANDLFISVTDNGIGVPDDVMSTAKGKGKGISNMKKRAGALGGVLTISRNADNLGTMIVLTISHDAQKL